MIQQLTQHTYIDAFLVVVPVKLQEYTQEYEHSDRDAYACCDLKMRSWCISSNSSNVYHCSLDGVDSENHEWRGVFFELGHMNLCGRRSIIHFISFKW